MHVLHKNDRIRRAGLRNPPYCIPEKCRACRKGRKERESVSQGNKASFTVPRYRFTNGSENGFCTLCLYGNSFGSIADSKYSLELYKYSLYLYNSRLKLYNSRLYLYDSSLEFESRPGLGESAPLLQLPKSDMSRPLTGLSVRVILRYGLGGWRERLPTVVRPLPEHGPTVLTQEKKPDHFTFAL